MCAFSESTSEEMISSDQPECRAKLQSKKLKNVPTEEQRCEGDAEGSTLTTVMIHLVQPGHPLGGCLARLFGQQGTT